MLKPTTTALTAFTNALPPGGVCCIIEPELQIPDSQTAIYTAILNGPAGSKVWARAWLWNETDNTLAETATGERNAGDRVTITVQLKDGRVPTHASMRIESAPLKTEHVVTFEL